jgi:type I restriction enzyme S subunit
MKRYDSYKDSGVKWLGELPEKWNLSKIKTITEIYGRIGFRGYTVQDIVEKTEGVISLSPSNITEQKLNVKKGTYISWEKYEESPEIKIYNGDIVFVKTASVGKTCYIENLIEPATLNPQLVVFKNLKCDSKFFYYVMISNNLNTQIKSDLVGGVIPTLSQSIIKNYYLFLPSRQEQTQIANYLDHKTTQLDNLISKKQKLIELLNEERTAIINQAVTKGLDPTVAMKDSGIEWLGEIPEHWEVTPVKYVANIQGRVGYKGYTVSDLVSEGEGPYTLGAKHINKKNQLDLSKPEFISWDKYYESPEIMVRTGDIIITQRGTLGKVVLIKEDIGEATINPSMVILKRLKVNDEFMYYFFNSNYFTSWIDFTNTATAVPMISQEQLGNFKLVLPPVDEQISLSQNLDVMLSHMDATLQKVQVEIELLKEYKTALISEVVTGKVDVRNEKLN